MCIQGVNDWHDNRIMLTYEDVGPTGVVKASNVKVLSEH